ncbi:hypothetical protein RYX36_023097 [Vicia faba]
MASVSTQLQFRYTQPPLKLLHLRNLSWDCIEEELIELRKPFDKVINTKCNVGENRNQAFIEFFAAEKTISQGTTSHPSIDEPLKPVQRLNPGLINKLSFNTKIDGSLHNFSSPILLHDNNSTLSISIPFH